MTLFLNVTELIECKTLVTNPVICNQISPFTFPKKGLIRIINRNNAYFLELYQINGKKCTITLEVFWIFFNNLYDLH